jgi:acyl-CoA thioesterase I
MISTKSKRQPKHFFDTSKKDRSGNMKIICIGSSIVNGFPLKRSQCWVSLWRNASGHEIINKGINGSTSEDMLLRFDADVLAHKPQMVFILTGTNDFIFEKCPPATVLQNLLTLTGIAKEHNIIPVLVTSLPVDVAMATEKWAPGAGYNYEKVRAQLSELHDRILTASLDYNLRVVDFYEVFDDFMGPDSNTASLYVDGIHPTALGHQILADTIIRMDFGGCH